VSSFPWCFDCELLYFPCRIKEPSISTAVWPDSHAHLCILRCFVMKFISTSTVVLSILLAGSVRAVTYKAVDTFEGASFFSGFDFDSAADPTHGRV